MRNPRFELPCRVRNLARGFSMTDGQTREGWMLTLELEATASPTLLRLFLPNSVLEEDRLIGIKPNDAKTMTIYRRPALRPGDTLILEVNLPVLDD